MIKENLERIKKRLDMAAAKRGIPVTDITLIAVTKTVFADAVRRHGTWGYRFWREQGARCPRPRSRLFPWSVGILSAICRQIK